MCGLDFTPLYEFDIFIRGIKINNRTRRGGFPVKRQVSSILAVLLFASSTGVFAAGNYYSTVFNLRNQVVFKIFFCAAVSKDRKSCAERRLIGIALAVFIYRRSCNDQQLEHGITH